MLSIIVSNGGETYYFATKQHNKESFKDCLCNVDLGNTKLITFFDEYNNVDVSISPLNSIITYKEI